MKNVLVLVDLSVESKNALNYAVELFENMQASFTVLRAEYSNDFGSVEYEVNRTNSIDQLVKTYELQNNLNHSYSVVNSEYSLITAIRTLFSTQKYDLIVMGVSSKKELHIQDFSWSFKTVKLIKALKDQSFLVVPEGFNFKGLKNALFSTNYKRPFFIKEFKLLVDLINNYDSALTITQVMREDYMTKNQKQNKETLQEILQHIKHDFIKIDLNTSEFKAVHEYAVKNDSKLITFINHKYNFFTGILEEHVAAKATIYSKVPVLILPES